VASADPQRIIGETDLPMKAALASHYGSAVAMAVLETVSPY